MSCLNHGNGFGIDIEKATLDNEYYRRVIYTTPQQQLVIMSLLPLEDIPTEIHPHTTQFLRFESGAGEVLINDCLRSVKDGVSITIPPNTYHRVVNTSSTSSLKLYTIYSPPEHSDQLIQPFRTP